MDKMLGVFSSPNCDNTFAIMSVTKKEADVHNKKNKIPQMQRVFFEYPSISWIHIGERVSIVTDVARSGYSPVEAKIKPTFVVNQEI